MDKDLQSYRNFVSLKVCLALLFMLFNINAFSQSLTLFDIDTSNFPIIKAKFYAFDKDGNQITNLSTSDFEVKENGVNRNVTLVSCPLPKEPVPLSSVLTIDVSGSMKSGGLNIAKSAANVWINTISLKKSECAVTSFDHSNYLNQDFTKDKNLLLSAVNSLSSKGGTDYNFGLLNPIAGSLQISKNGKHKKVVVFLTDGMPNDEPDIEAIISEANRQNCNIYSVVIGMKCPRCLKDISTRTGGLWFENIGTVEDAQNVYKQILFIAQDVAPCSIEWESGITCTADNTNYEISITNLGLEAKGSYTPPSSSVAQLQIVPSTVSFKNPEIGIKKDTIITVTAINHSFNITSINLSNPAFMIVPTSFLLNAGESIDLTLSYVAADSGYNYCAVEFINDLCPKKYRVYGGYAGKKPRIRTLKLIHPNGGEVFVVGSDTYITWDGVLPDEPVKIEYSTDNGATWLLITEKAKDLSYKWRVPKTPSNQCLARVTVVKSSFLDIDMVLIPAGTFQMGNTVGASGYESEKPIHSVTISRDFLMSKYEITQKQYETVMGKNPSYFKGENLPVENINWYDAIEFCNKLSDMEGLERVYHGAGTSTFCDWNANGYRLPTEAEWEYACKAGTTTDFYNRNITYSDCSPLDPNLDSIGWYCGNSGTKSHIVGEKQPNGFGLYDMSGNVYEWCWDWFGLYNSSPATDPKGTNRGAYRVLRGGSWFSSSNSCRSSYRGTSDPSIRHGSYGIRICRNY